MKKIYILTAVLALLTLSLNAQMLPYKAIGKESVYQDKGKPGSTAGLFHAPAKINTANGEFLVGPYTTDDFSTTGKGLYNTTSYGRVEVSTVIPRSDIEQYIGQEIVGYRFATVGGTVSCYSFLVESEGPNYYIDDLYYWNIQSDGSYIDLSGNQWHEYYLDEPVVFQIPDTTQAIWIGYKYYQESSNNGSYTMTPIAVNPNVTSYECYAYSYNQNNQGFYDVTSTLGGAVAAQLIFKAPSTDPKITASPTSVSMSTTPGETATETVTVTGANLTSGITATISGTDASLFSVSPASLGTSGGDLTITYSPTANGNHTATLTLSSTGAQDVVITLNGTCSSDVTICDGTDTNGYLPIYGFYCDDYQINQMIYPEITSLVGKNITSMTFYATAPLDANLSSVDWNVKLGTTTQTSFASSLGSITRLVPDDVTTVAEGYVITSGINTMTITFSTPFTYNGGNLLIDFQSTVEGQYKATDFYGVNQSTYTGYNSYRSSNATPNQNGHYSSGGVRQFLPKVTFTVEANNKTATPTLSMVNNGDGTYTITATAASPDTDAEVTLNVTGQQPVTGTGSASITITQTDADQPVTATATAQATDKLVSNEASENFIVPALPITPTPAITYVVNGDNVVITATGQGEVTLNVTGQEPVTGNGTVSITLPRTDANYTVTATATAQAAYHQESAQASEQITIPFLQTSTPTITYTTQGENVIITATATAPDADAEVTLTVGNGEPVIGTGSVSVTVPCGVTSTTVTATATAKVDGKAQSETATEQVPIPAGEGWIEMDGTYNNPGDLLTLEKNGEDIMLVDQFLASTYNNEHSDGYTYTMKETIDNVDWFSNPAPIPVHKTSSTLQGLYTQTQVDNDTLMQYRANVLNTEIDFNVEPDPMVMYYDLYRGAKNAEYPSVVPTTEISRLQQFIDNVNNNIEYYYFETHQSGIAPRYDHVGEQLVERIDTGYVDGIEGDEIAYVPVMWVPGQATARGDGKNNSYGSDIKHNWLGGVTIDWIRGTVSTNSVNGVDYGKWTAPNGVEYCVYTPWIKVSGIQPADWTGHDHDQYTFTPYMYRVWCIYPDARDFTHNADGQLTDANVELPDTMLLQTVYVDDPTVTSIYFGKEQWVPADGHLPYAIGVPTSVADNPSVLQFVVRFYYKRNVVEGSQPSGLRDGGEEYYIAEGDGDGEEITTGIVEFYSGKAIVDVTYVNAQGMKSDKPFSGVNIVITRYSDGTTSTTKVVR